MKKKSPQGNIIRRTRHFFREKIWTFKEPDHIKALSIGVGVFIGLTPFWGFQTLLAIGISLGLRLNKVLTVGASYISFPPVIPVVVYLQLNAGLLILGQPSVLQQDLREKPAMDTITGHLLPYITGCFILGIFIGGTVTLLSWILLKLMRRNRESEHLTGASQEEDTENFSQKTKNRWGR